MSATFADAHGGEYRLVAPVEGDGGGYASLFTQATAYRAHRLAPAVDDLQDTGERCPSDATAAAAPATTVLVTHITLTSSLQDAPASSEAAALEAVLRNLALRRRIRHSLLRTLVDAFFTDQQLSCTPALSNASGNGGGESVARVAASSAACDERDSVHHSSTLTALIVIEEFCEGCSLADYANAVSSGRLTCSDAKLQRDAAAVVYPLASVLHHVHTSTPIVCRAVPLECVFLDVNQGTLRVRLPLSAVCRDVELDGVDGSDSLGCPAVDFGLRDDVPTLCAPELCRLRGWGTAEAAAALLLDGGGVSASADVWALGTVLLELCALNRSELAGPRLHAERERAAVLLRHIENPDALLPPGVHPTVAQLVGACLETVPRQRPSMAAVLKAAAFSTHRSFSRLEQSRAVISIAEAVLQTRTSEAAAAEQQNTVSPRTWADAGLAMLTLPGLSWSTPDAFREALFPDGALPGEREAATGAAVPLSPDAAEAGLSLASMTQEALQDVTRLHARYRDLGTRNVAASSDASVAAGNAALRARVRRSRQLPRDIASTAKIMDDLTEHFAQLEQSDPRSCLRLMELLVEGFAASDADVEAVASGLVVADALLHASPTAVTSPTGGHDLASLDGSVNLDDASVNSEAEAPSTGFSVADTLRVMPSMPAQVYSSDRAANTTAVLYNSWLRKQKKKHLKMDGF